MPKQNKKTPPRPKTLYHVKNWAAYDKALVQRGSITFWMSDDVQPTWRYGGAKQRGSQFDYSEQAILILLTVKEVCPLTNRGVEGCVRSLFQLMQLELPVPDHSTLSNRGQTWQVSLPKTTRQPRAIVMDSTGLKIYGAGEWKVRMHGASKRRTGRKLHVGVNPDSGEIQAVLLTENHISDAEAVPSWLAQIEQPIVEFAADGAYDQRKVYDALNTHSPDTPILIPPRQNAHIGQQGNTKAARLKRDEHLRYIRQYGRAAWKQETGYHVRCLAETNMVRLKTILGDALSTRLLETQTTQALVRCAALNRMTHLGMPHSYKVA